MAKQVDINSPSSYKKCSKKSYEVYVCMPPKGTVVINKFEQARVVNVFNGKTYFTKEEVEKRGKDDILLSFVNQGMAYVVSDKTPFVIAGTRGELWAISADKLASTYTFLQNGQPVAINQQTLNQRLLKNGLLNWTLVRTSSQATMGQNMACFVPSSQKCQVQTAWGAVLNVNGAGVHHGKGDFIVCAMTPDGNPNIADRWVVNGEIFATTYNNQGWADCIKTPSTIKNITISDLPVLVTNDIALNLGQEPIFDSAINSDLIKCLGSIVFASSSFKEFRNAMSSVEVNKTIERMREFLSKYKDLMNRSFSKTDNIKGLEFLVAIEMFIRTVHVIRSDAKLARRFYILSKCENGVLDTFRINQIDLSLVMKISSLCNFNLRVVDGTFTLFEGVEFSDESSYKVIRRFKKIQEFDYDGFIKASIERGWKNLVPSMMKNIASSLESIAKCMGYYSSIKFSGNSHCSVKISSQAVDARSSEAPMFVDDNKNRANINVTIFFKTDNDVIVVSAREGGLSFNKEYNISSIIQAAMANDVSGYDAVVDAINKLSAVVLMHVCNELHISPYNSLTCRSYLDAIIRMNNNSDDKFHIISVKNGSFERSKDTCSARAVLLYRDKVTKEVLHEYNLSYKLNLDSLKRFLDDVKKNNKELSYEYLLSLNIDSYLCVKIQYLNVNEIRITSNLSYTSNQFMFSIMNAVKNEKERQKSSNGVQSSKKKLKDLSETADALHKSYYKWLYENVVTYVYNSYNIETSGNGDDSIVRFTIKGGTSWFTIAINKEGFIRVEYSIHNGLTGEAANTDNPFSPNSSEATELLNWIDNAKNKIRYYQIH